MIKIGILALLATAGVTTAIIAPGTKPDNSKMPDTIVIQKVGPPGARMMRITGNFCDGPAQDCGSIQGDLALTDQKATDIYTAIGVVWEKAK